VAYYEIENNCPYWSEFTALRRSDYPDALNETHELRTAVADCFAWDPAGSPDGSVWHEAVIPAPLFDRVRRAINALFDKRAGTQGSPITREGLLARAQAIGLGTATLKYLCSGVWMELERAVKEMVAADVPTDDQLLAVQLACDAATDLPLAMSRAWVKRSQRTLNLRWPVEARNDTAVLHGLTDLAAQKVSGSRVLTQEEADMLKTVSDDIERNYHLERAAVLYVSPEQLMRSFGVPQGIRVANVAFDPAHACFAFAIVGDSLPVEPVPCCDRLPVVHGVMQQNENGVVTLKEIVKELQ